jgi:hypothetical protein
MSSVFDYINSINFSKKNIMEEDGSEKEYIPYIVNKTLSYFSDTIMHSNELNIRPLIPKKYQYEYYLKTVRPRKRFSKWLKKTDQPDIEIIKKYYNISSKKALEYLSILTKQQIKQLKKEMNEGGLA